MKLRLVIRVELTENGTPKEELIHKLNRIARDAEMDGSYTGTTEAELKSLDYEVIDEDNPAPIIIDTMLKSGELGTDEFHDTKALLDQAGQCLDSSASHEILGDVYFKGKDGKFYQVSTEAVITEVTRKSIIERFEGDDPPDFADSVRAEYVSVWPTGEARSKCLYSAALNLCFYIEGAETDKFDNEDGMEREFVEVNGMEFDKDDGVVFLY